MKVQHAGILSSDVGLDLHDTWKFEKMGRFNSAMPHYLMPLCGAVMEHRSTVAGTRCAHACTPRNGNKGALLHCSVMEWDGMFWDLLHFMDVFWMCYMALCSHG